MRTREEHLAWGKERALAYLPGDPINALTSMLSDIEKHPETSSPALATLTVQLMALGSLSTPEDARRHIEGFR